VFGLCCATEGTSLSEVPYFAPFDANIDRVVESAFQRRG
jgi:hypothetical protein